jgi:small subunit ribosomal protein S8
MKGLILDKLADSIGRIYNASRSNMVSTTIPSNSLVRRVLILLYREGFINTYKVLDSGEIEVFPKYIRNIPVMRGFRRVSLIKRRVYVSFEDLQKVALKHPNVFFILSTRQGLDIFDAILIRSKKMGGELIAMIEI